MTTRTYRKILLPVDGSDIAKKAVRTGLELARLSDAEVTAISVIDLTKFRSTSQGVMLPDMFAYMEQAAEAAVEDAIKEGKAMGIEVKGLIARGSPATDIIEHSKDYDIIVMGTAGRTGFSRAALGSVAEKVVRFAACPVMVVK